MPDINGIPYVESTDLVSAYPAASQALAQEISDQLAEKLPYSYGTATPSTTDSGFLWFDSNSTPAAPKFWDGSAFQDFPSGLSFVTADTFSAVSSVSFDNLFSTATRDFRVMISASGSTNLALTMRLRTSGSDASSAYWFSGIGSLITSDAPVYFARSNNAAQWTISNTITANRLLILDFHNVSQAANTYVTGHQIDNSGLLAYNVGGTHTTATAYDGLTLTASTGNITGNIRVYAYKAP